jgi:hypothetical protein
MVCALTQHATIPEVAKKQVSAAKSQSYVQNCLVEAPSEFLRGYALD